MRQASGAFVSIAWRRSTSRPRRQRRLPGSRPRASSNGPSWTAVSRTGSTPRASDGCACSAC